MLNCKYQDRFLFVEGAKSFCEGMGAHSYLTDIESQDEADIVHPLSTYVFNVCSCQKKEKNQSFDAKIANFVQYKKLSLLTVIEQVGVVI